MAGQSDIWALGVILFILLTGKLPFYGSYEDDLYRKIISAKYTWPPFLTNKAGKPSDHSAQAKNLVRRILNPDASRRPTAQQILKDPWMLEKAEK